MKTKERAKSKKEPQKDISASYNAFKEFEGKRYTGMKIGRTHAWIYETGEWKEKKITPDEWQITYAVKKRRKGKAPENSGVPIGTEYHWYILSHQFVKKLDANTYSTEMTGVKFKLAHKLADKDKWSVSDRTRKKHLIKFLEDVIVDLYDEIKLDELASSAKKAVKKANTAKKTGKEKVPAEA